MIDIDLVPILGQRLAIGGGICCDWFAVLCVAVGPALREAALGLFGFPITMVAQTEEPSGLKPIPRLRPGVCSISCAR